MAWQKPSLDKNPIVRLAKIASRLNRLKMLLEVQQVNSMIALHTPSIRKHPRGKKALQDAFDQLKKLHAHLRKDVPNA